MGRLCSLEEAGRVLAYQLLVRQVTSCWGAGTDDWRLANKLPHFSLYVSPEMQVFGHFGQVPTCVPRNWT